MRQIEIYEVGPRDGFQNICHFIPTQDKLEIINDLVTAEVKYIQLTSYVSPKAIPQMSDARELTKLCKERYPDVDWFALVPNLFGAKTANELGIDYISYVVSLSKSHNKANINRSHQESFDEFIQIRQTYPNMKVCIDLATTFGCPFEGKYIHNEAVEFVRPYIEEGIEALNLCDTIGIADPAQVRELISRLRNRYPDVNLMVHIHDTRNMGMVNALAAVESGVDLVQSAIGGLGGCPFAPGASGNLATEDFVYMLHEMGYDTGIDAEKLIDAAKHTKKILQEGVFSGHHININENIGERSGVD